MSSQDTQRVSGGTGGFRRRVTQIRSGELAYRVVDRIEDRVDGVDGVDGSGGREDEERRRERARGRKERAGVEADDNVICGQTVKAFLEGW